MKGWVGLVGWLVADGLPTLVVTHQLQVERRTEKVRQSETDVLPLCYATNQSKFIYPKSLGPFDKLETSGVGCCIAGMMINVLAYADDIVLMAPSCARQPSRGKYRAATRAGYHASAALASHTADWCRTTAVLPRYRRQSACCSQWRPEHEGWARAQCQTVAVAAPPSETQRIWSP